MKKGKEKRVGGDRAVTRMRRGVSDGGIEGGR